MDARQNVQMGISESKESIMPGTFPGEAERCKDELCGSGGSGTSSITVNVNRSNQTVATFDAEDDTCAKLSAKHPHPFSFRFLTSVDVKNLWEEIELKKTRLQDFDALQVMSGLSLLEHAEVSKEALLSCPIMDQVGSLRTHRVREIAAKASGVLPRLESIISSSQNLRSAPKFKESLQNLSPYADLTSKLSPDTSTSRGEVDAPASLRNDTLGDASDAVPLAKPPRVPPVPLPSEKLENSMKINYRGLFSGFEGTGEKLPLQLTMPPPKVEAFSKMTSQLSTSSFTSNSENRANCSKFRPKSRAPVKGVFSSSSFERQTEQPVPRPTFSEPLYRNSNEQKTQQTPFGQSNLLPGGIPSQALVEQESSVKNTVPEMDAPSSLIQKIGPDFPKTLAAYTC